MVKNSKSLNKTPQTPPVRGKQTHPSSGGRTSAAGAPKIKEKAARARVNVAPAKVARALPPLRKESVTTSFTFYANPTLALVCVPAGASVLFSLEDAAHLTDVHPDLLRYYGRVGLINTVPGTADGELLFDEDALLEIRRIEHYRRHLGVGRRALPLVCELRREGERQEIELRFLRYP